MQLNEITLHCGCSPVFWLHIFRAHFHRNTPGRLLLVLPNLEIDNLNQILGRYLWRRSYFVKLQALLKNELLLNTCFKEHLWWAAYEDFLYHPFYNSIRVKIIQSLSYCPHYMMFRLMKNWNISLIVEYMKIHVLLLISRWCERKALMPLWVGVCCWRMAVGWVWLSVW